MSGRRLPGAGETYEILALRDGHWQVAMVMAGEGARPGRAALAQFEAKIRRLATAQLEIQGTRSVKVVRERLRPDGSLTVSEFLCLDDAGTGTKIIGLAPIRDGGPRCETPSDLLQRPACQFIGMLLRGLLDLLGASPLELLTDEGWARRLQAHEALLASAVRKVAALQATGDPNARAQTLERLLAEHQRNARAAAAWVPRLPDLDPGGLDMLLARIRALGTVDHEFLALRAVARHLDDGAAPITKIARLLDLLTPDLSPAATALVDRFLAGFLDAPSTVEALVGGEPDLGAALVVTAGLATGAAPGTGGALAARLAEPLAAGQLPDARGALWDRVAAGLLSHRPLAADARAAWSALRRLEQELAPRAPECRRCRLAAAFAARKLALDRAGGPH